MRDILEEFVTETILTVDNVRELVDDYSLISHYIGQELELYTKYSSPLREGMKIPLSLYFMVMGDMNPNKLYFKDQVGIAQGDVYTFLQLYLRAKSISEVLEQINYDLKTGIKL